jgi:uncharacterized protein
MTPIGPYPTTFDLVPHELFDLNPILLGRVGSRAYGTDMPESDSDYMGVCIAPADCYVGLKHWHNDGTKEFKREADGFDSVSYELKKFLNLCMNFNPNVIPLLWLRPEDYILLEPEGQVIIDNRKLFNSKRAYHTFLGYAKGQIHRMKVGSTGKLGAQRKALVEKYGYDTKFAYHTIRLLRMVKEFFLSNGENLGVFRAEDAEELKNIRAGSLMLEDFYRYCDELMEEISGIYSTSTIPENPDFDSVNDMCMHLIKVHNRG